MIERIASCACGKVQFKALGEPILSAVCHCSDCQAGARLIEAMPQAPAVRDAFGGSPYLTYRNDRFACLSGAEHLLGVKLSQDAPTTRFVAACCNSGMHLKYGPGWWTSVYRARFADPPPLQMRTQVRNLPPGVTLPDDAPSYRGFPLKLFARLILARVAMGL
jgi:hypothetical protein